MPRSSFVPPAALGFMAALFPAVAPAQVYQFTETTETYVSLAGRAVVTTPFAFSAADDGTATLTLPFTFRYFGVDRTSVLVSTNGVLRFGSTSVPSLFNQPITQAPDGIIAVWWDDLIVPAVSGHARTAVIGTAPDRAFVIEVEDWERFSFAGINDGAYQVWLYEGALGRFEVRYGRTLTASENYTATVGYRSEDGAEVRAFRPCGNSCSAADGSTLAGRVFAVQRLDEPDLRAGLGMIPRGALPGQTANIPVSITNLGPRPAGASRASVFLSADDTLDPADPEVGGVDVAALGGGQGIMLNASITVPANIRPIDARLLLQADRANVVAEGDETNNVAVSATRFATAADLVPSAVSGPPGVAVGATASFEVDMANVGVPYAGPVDVSIRLSPDALNDVTDPVVGTARPTLTGAAAQTFSIAATIPPGTARGLYYGILVVDPANRIAELSRGNNVRVTAAPFRVGPDFAVADVDAPTSGNAGDTVQVTTDLGSIGAAYTGPVTYALHLSEDDAFDPLDPRVGAFTVNMTGSGVTDARTVTLPPSATADRRWIVVVDPAGLVTEADETNNVFVDAAVARFGINLSIFSLDYDPREVEADDTFDWTARLRLDTNPRPGDVAYRLLLSDDTTLDPADRTVANGTATVDAVGTYDVSGTVDLSTVSPPVLPGEYDLFIVVDPDDAVPERRETDNFTRGFGDLTVQGPNFVPSALVSDREAFAGQAYTVQFRLQNVGAADAGAVTYGYYVTRTGVITDGERVGGGSVAPLAAGATINVFDTLTLTATLAAGPALFGVIVDPVNDVDEQSEGDNVALRPDAIEVRAPVPDLAGTVVDSSTQAAAGETLAVTTVLRNTGFVATPFTYAYVLVVDPDRPESDVLIGRLRASLDPGDILRQLDVIDVPPTVPSGAYRVGVVLDPDRLVPEVDDANNRSVGPSVFIYPPDLTVITDTLPEARLGLMYGSDLAAVGGAFAYTWRLAGGRLPGGMSLSPEGRLTGAPTEDGVFDFHVEVASGERTARRGLSLVVREADVRLAVVAAPLPVGVLGRAYSARLVAVGGQRPLTWAAVGLPPGLDLDGAGMFSGVPQAVGPFEVRTTVVDGVGAVASATVALRVVDVDQAVRIDPSALPTAVRGAAYCTPDLVRLIAIGGFQPYRWAAEGLPEGLTLAEDGTLCGTPAEAGRFDVVFTVNDAVGQTDTLGVVFRVTDEEAVVVRTVALPPAGLGTPYEAALSAVGGDAPYAWSIDLGTLPLGLALGGDGRISGVPTAPGLYAFAVRATDSAGRSAIRALSVEVLGPSDFTEATGCRCARPRGPSSWWLVVGLAAVVGGRRRFGRRGR